MTSPGGNIAWKIITVSVLTLSAVRSVIKHCVIERCASQSIDDLYDVDESRFKKTVSGITSDVICHQLKYTRRLFLSCEVASAG